MNPVDLFGKVDTASPTCGHILAEQLGRWEFRLYPQLWNDSELSHISGLLWTKIKFGATDQATLNSIPAGAGIYYFTVEGRRDLIDGHQYLFYAGKAESGLRSRYKDYIQERAGEDPEEDRNKVTLFLKYFQGFIFWHYHECAKASAAKLESALKDNFTPPVNTILKIKGRLYK